MDLTSVVGALSHLLPLLAYPTEVLSVGNNDLNGTIPDVFHHTKNLIALDLHKNEFSGSLPASLGELTALGESTVQSMNVEGMLSDLSNQEEFPFTS